MPLLRNPIHRSRCPVNKTMYCSSFKSHRCILPQKVYPPRPNTIMVAPRTCKTQTQSLYKVRANSYHVLPIRGDATGGAE